MTCKSFIQSYILTYCISFIYCKMTGGTHPKRKTKKYSEEQLQNALTAVRSKYDYNFCNICNLHFCKYRHAILLKINSLTFDKSIEQRDWRITFPCVSYS